MKIHGLLLLDKPAGLSSNTALQKARRLLDADKAGHGGTLDPLASGLLPVLLGEACKLAASALDGDKGYLADVRLGLTTTTDDAEGEIIEQKPVAVDDAALAVALQSFRGEIIQVPPVYSALKVGGKALYRYAREGTPVQIAARPVTIHSLQLEHRDGDTLRLRVACSKGTYIRALARDLGQLLGCGAYLSGLRRTVVGRFGVADAVDLDALAAEAPEQRAARLIGLEALIADWPSATLDDAAAARFRQGQAVEVPADAVTLPDLDDRVAVLCGARLIGLGRIEAQGQQAAVLSPTRVIVTA